MLRWKAGGVAGRRNCTRAVVGCGVALVLRSTFLPEPYASPKSRLRPREVRAEILYLDLDAASRHRVGDGAVERCLDCWRRPKIEPLLRVVPTEN
jgi:hypothetical protein